MVAITKIIRFIKIKKMLLEYPRYTQQEIADELKVSRKTINRDMKELKAITDFKEWISNV